MFSRIRSLVIVVSTLTLLGFVGNAGALGQSPRGYGQPIVLFGGNSLDGWARNDGQPVDGWIIDEGALYRSKPAGDLYYEHTLRDFELHFQWKISEGGNSGVKYRVRQYGNQWLGCEYQLLDDRQNPFNKHASGSMYDIYEPNENKVPVSHGVWNWSKIVVCGTRIEHWMNGRLVVAANVGDNQWNDRINRSKFRGQEAFGENREGRIFLQDHGNPVWFRHIVLVPLRCDDGAGTDTPPATAGGGQVVTGDGCRCEVRCCSQSGPLIRSRCGWFRRRMCR